VGSAQGYSKTLGIWPSRSPWGGVGQSEGRESQVGYGELHRGDKGRGKGTRGSKEGDVIFMRAGVRGGSNKYGGLF